MNVNTGEFRALTEQVERLTGIMENHQGLLIRALVAQHERSRPEPDGEPPAPVLRLVHGGSGREEQP